MDRPSRPSPYHSGVHDGVWVRDRLTIFVAFRGVAILRDMFVLSIVGNGAAHLAYSRSISTWFQKRLGMALAFVTAGTGMGAMILPVMAQVIVSHFGWRAAYAALGGLALLLGLPLSWHYIRKRGETPRKFATVAHSGMTWQLC